MAIRLLHPETKAVIMDVNYRVEKRSNGQLITGFREGLAVCGYIHTHQPEETDDFSYVVEVKQGIPTRVTLTTISSEEIIAEGY